MKEVGQGVGDAARLGLRLGPATCMHEHGTAIARVVALTSMSMQGAPLARHSCREAGMGERGTRVASQVA